MIYNSSGDSEDEPKVGGASTQPKAPPKAQTLIYNDGYADSYTDSYATPSAEAQTDKETVERLVSGLAGAAFEGMDAVGSGITAVWNFNKSVLRTVGQIAEPLKGPLDALGLTEIVRQPVEAVVNGMEVRVAQLEEKGREGLTQTGTLTIQAISGTIDLVLDYLSTHPQVDKLIADKIDKVLPLLGNNPEVQKLVRTQVDTILPLLAEDPRIQQLIQKQAGMYLATLGKNLDPNLKALIRLQGDDYIEYLNAHPESVQNLVAGQTLGLTTEIMNEVRERAVTADSVLEMVVRRVLGRKQREQLPPPPVEVQRRAEAARLPSDFVEEATPRQLPSPNGTHGGGTYGD